MVDDEDGALAERYRPNCHQQRALTVEFITRTMLTLRPVLIAVINEVSCQLIVSPPRINSSSGDNIININ